MTPVTAGLLFTGSLEALVHAWNIPMPALSLLMFGGVMIAYSGLAFAASGAVGRLTWRVHSVRTRMVILGIVGGALGFLLHGQDVRFHLEGLAQPYQSAIDTAFGLVLICLWIWVFAVAM